MKISGLATVTKSLQSTSFPEHTYSSACRPVRDGKGCHSGGISVFVSSRVKQHVEVAVKAAVKAAADASCLLAEAQGSWARLS